MITRTQQAGVLTVLGGLVLAGCSASVVEASPHAPAASHTTVGSPARSAAGRPADAATTSAVSTVYARFFDSATSPVDSQKFLQHGAEFATVLEKQAQGAQAQHATASVSQVRLTGPDLATVRFTISSGGKALLPNVSGFAVRENGTWLVAAVTFCGLLKLQGQQADACADPSSTALPS